MPVGALRWRGGATCDAEVVGGGARRGGPGRGEGKRTAGEGLSLLDAGVVRGDWGGRGGRGRRGGAGGSVAGAGRYGSNCVRLLLWPNARVRS